MTENETIGNNIRRLRELMNLTQEQVAEYLMVDRALISFYETGKRNIPTTALTKLATLFGVDEYDFYELDENMQQAKFAFAFRSDKIEPDQLEHIAVFKKIVINYLNMEKALSDKDGTTIL